MRHFRRRLTASVQWLDREQDKLVGSTFREPEPDLLYHFTPKLEYVESILSGGQIRATLSTQVQGDREELRAGEEIAEQLARDMLSAEKRSLAKEILGRFVDEFELERISEKYEVFVSCFSPEAEQRHWEEYANHGAGFALRFRVLKHRHRPREPHLLELLMRVYYDAGVVRSRLQTAFRRSLEMAEKALSVAPHSRDVIARMARSTLFRIAALAATQTKRQPFDWEGEWRMIVVPMAEAMHRVQRAEPRTFLPIELNPGGLPALYGVYVGPNHENPQRAAAELRAILETHRYPPGIPVLLAP